MKYTQIPQDTFKKLQLNAGIFVDEFTPSSGEIGNILMATTGGADFEATPSYKDRGENIDNCPKNTMELKELESWDDIKISGTAKTVDGAIAKDFIAAADVSGNKVTPRNHLKRSDFHDVWWVGDYSDVNDGNSAGFMAIHLINALSTEGFKLKSTDKDTGEFAFSYTAHYSISAQDTVPFELYVSTGSAGA